VAWATPRRKRGDAKGRIIHPLLTETVHPASPADENEPAPQNWREAVVALIATRVTIFEAESREASRQMTGSLVKLVTAAVFALFAWLLLVGAIIGILAAIFGWPWYWTTLGACGIHLLAAFILLTRARAGSRNHFPVTRSEFLKDREWLKNFQKRKSND
jgi:uncharacterized membrane protein YqjE